MLLRLGQRLGAIRHSPSRPIRGRQRSAAAAPTAAATARSSGTRRCGSAAGERLAAAGASARDRRSSTRCCPGEICVEIDRRRGRRPARRGRSTRLRRASGRCETLRTRGPLAPALRAGRSRTTTPSPRLTGGRPARTVDPPAAHAVHLAQEHAALRGAAARRRASCDRARPASRARSRARTTAPSPRRRAA